MLEPVKVHTTTTQSTLCATIMRLGYAQHNQLKLYGEVFDLVSDPFSVGDNLVCVDALERRTGRLRRVRIPLTIVQTAKQKLSAA
jgi:hypothetical protein